MITKGLSTLKRVQPSFIEPMLAESVHVLPDNGAWSYEAKFDGYYLGIGATMNRHDFAVDQRVGRQLLTRTGDLGEPSCPDATGGQRRRHA